jgi:hypothetical protein
MANAARARKIYQRLGKLIDHWSLPAEVVV